MKKILSLIIIGLLCLSMFSMLAPYMGQAESSEPPVTEWDETYGGVNMDSTTHTSFVQTSDGGYALAGYTASFGAGSWDFWLVKTDSQGIEQWNRAYGGGAWDEGRSVVQTSDGGYALAGATKSFGAGDWDVWLVKVDSSGNVQWDKTYGGPSSDWASAIIRTNDGGYALTGSTHNWGAGIADVWLVKVDSSGNVQWNQTYGGTNGEKATHIIKTSDGGYAMVGNTYSFGAGDSDFWLVKVDLDGNMQWNQTYGGANFEECMSFVETLDGGYMLAGYTASFGAGSWDFWLVKTDSLGNEQWNETYGGTDFDRAWSVVQTSDGAYVIAGHTMSFGAGSEDMWLIKTNSTGHVEWSETYGGTSRDRAYTVLQASDGGYAIAGMTESFGAGSEDMWLIKLAPPLGMVSYWRLNESSGTTAYDSVGDNDGTLVNGPVWTTGIVDGGLSFDGIDDYVEVSHNPDLNIGGDGKGFTAEAWIKTPIPMGSQQIVRKGFGAVQYEFKTWGYGTLLRLIVYPYGTSYHVLVDATIASDDGNWHHVAATKSASDNLLRIYFDGELVGTSTSPCPGTEASTAPLWIGTELGPGYWFRGTIDEVAIHNRALASEEIQQHYENGLMGLDYFSEPEILASGLDDPEGILVHDGLVYWAERQYYGGQGGRIGKVPIGGGTVTSLAAITHPTYKIVTDGIFIYAATELLAPGYIKKIRISDGFVTDLIPSASPWANYIYTVTLLDDNVYWSSSTHAGDTGGIWSVSKDGGPIQELARLHYHSMIDTSPGESWIYVAERDNIVRAGDVVRVPASGGAFEVLYDSIIPLSAGFPDVEDGYVYWPATAEGKICRIPTSGGSREILAEGEDRPFSVLVDNGYVYWAALTSISRVPIDGSGPVEQLACGLVGPRFLAVSDGHLYWSELGWEHALGVSWSPGIGTIKKIPLPELAWDFEVSVSPDFQTVETGESVSYEISLTHLNGVSSEVYLEADWVGTPPTTGTPSLMLDPGHLTPPGVSDFTVATYDDTELGQYTIRLTAVSGDLTRSVEVNLVIMRMCIISVVPLIDQETPWACWAAASEMVLEYYGLYGPEISQIQIARELEHEEYYTTGIPNWQTWPILGRWEWALENLGKLEASFSGGISFNDIVHDIDSATPIIALYKTGPRSGHAVAIVGYVDNPGTSDDKVIANDPWPPASQIEITWSELQTELYGAIRTQVGVEKSSVSIHFTETAFGGFRRYAASSSTPWFWWFMLRVWSGPDPTNVEWKPIADAPDQYIQGGWAATIDLAKNPSYFYNYRLRLSTSPLAPTTWDVNIEFVARALGFRAESPLNLLVTDPSGSSTGYDSVSEQMMTEIPRATYSGPSSEPQLIVIPDPLDGEYMVLLTGINSGTYTLTTDFVLPEGTTTKTHTGEIVEDAVYVYSVSITDEEMTATPDSEADLEHLKEFIDGLPDVSFDKPKLANQMKNALFNKIDEVILKAEAGNYTDAINKLFHDIRAKMDGDSTAQDWIIDPEMQTSLCVIIDHIISNIETLQPQSD